VAVQILLRFEPNAQGGRKMVGCRLQYSIGFPISEQRERKEVNIAEHANSYKRLQNEIYLASCKQ
jgi:hypothetical protein